MPVASCSASMPAPPRIACCTCTRRDSVGVRIATISASRAAPDGAGPFQWKLASRFSNERNAFCSASVKQRPIAIASPTLFIVVVSVGSAEVNFSNANRGALTTT